MAAPRPKRLPAGPSARVRHLTRTAKVIALRADAVELRSAELLKRAMGAGGRP